MLKKLDIFLGNLFAFIGISAAILFLVAVFGPALYAVSRWDKPMMDPEANGMTLHEYYLDRLDAYAETAEAIGWEPGDPHDIENPILRTIMVATLPIFEPINGCAGDYLAAHLYLVFLPLKKTIEEQSFSLEGWWMNVEYYIRNYYEVNHGTLKPCQLRPPHFPEALEATQIPTLTP